MTVAAAVQAIRARTALEPQAAIILGTGLGALAEAITIEAAIPYADIPGFPVPTVESHAGRLLCGSLEGRPVVAMQGRFHRYEGYELDVVTFPVRVLRALGADVVGMSTVPEVVVARQEGMRVLGLSIITDLCLPDALEPATVERILTVAREAEPRLATLVRGVVAGLN